MSQRSRIAMAQQNPPDIALVLIVDDDAEVLELIADVVQTLGYHVLTARSGPDAIYLLRKNSQVSVLFTDIRMPSMGGEQLAEIAVAFALAVATGLLARTVVGLERVDAGFDARNVLTLTPPLTVTEAEMSQALDIIDACIASVTVEKL